MSVSILVVDDEPVNVEVLYAFLEPEQYRLVAACSGEEAVATDHGWRHQEEPITRRMMRRVSR